jgi:hypothetical protein
MRRIACSLLLAATLAGCGLPRDRIEPGMRWVVGDVAKDRASLALGVPDTDDLQMMLSCRPFSGDVEITIVGRPDDGAVVELRSGEVIGRYPGAGHDDEETTGAVDIDLRLPADAPVLQSFAATGKLEIHFTDRWVRLPNGFAQAHDFLRLCQRRAGP